MRKPYKNETVTYNGSVAGIVRSVEGNICYFDDVKGLPSCFIWSFKEGPNKLFGWPGKTAIAVKKK